MALPCNGLPPVPWEAIVWTNSNALSIRPIGMNLREILIKVPSSL